MAQPPTSESCGPWTRKSGLAGGDRTQLIPNRDELRTAPVRRQVHQPLEPDDQTVAKADQKHQVHEQPREPSEHTRETKLADRHDGMEASDRGHAALIDVAEGLRVWCPG